MKGSSPILALAVSFVGLVVGSCSLSLPEPSLTLQGQSVYFGTQVQIQYTIDGITNSGGQYTCAYILHKKDEFTGSYFTVPPSTPATNTQDYPAKGSFTVDLNSYRFPYDVAALNPQTVGEFSVTFSVLTGNYDAQGNPIPISYLTKTLSFTVQASGTSTNGPTIFGANTPIVDQSSPTLITLKGSGFTATSTLTVSSPASLSGLTVTPPDTMSASLSCSGCTVGSTVSLQISDVVNGQNVLSQSYNFLVVSPISVSSVTPLPLSSGVASQQIVVSGQPFGSWTSLTMTDAVGSSIPTTITSFGSGYIILTANLSAVALGYATMTLSNPDGSTTSYPISVN